MAMAVVVCLVAAACGNKAGPEPGPDPSSTAVSKGPPFAGKPTSALVQRAEVATLVDDLAKEKQIESSHIGAGGSPSQVYAKFVAITKAATEAEMVALLQHESPIVRGYVAEHVAEKLPARLDSVVPLAEDWTGVPTLNGCMKGMDSIGEIVVQSLCRSRDKEAGAALLSISNKGGAEAARALECAAPSEPKIAAEKAVTALRGEVKPMDEVAYLNVLATAQAADPKEACALANKRAKSGDASVQIAAANALWRCGDTESRDALERLAAGKNEVVARYAKASLFLLVPEKRAALWTDREVVREVASRLGRVLRSAEGAKGSLALAEALALEHPTSFGETFREAAVTPETTQSALRIASKLEPSTTAAWGAARTGVIAYLSHAKDPAGLPEIRRSLGAGNSEEIIYALRGVSALKDKASRGAVEKLTKHSDKYLANVAVETLAAL